MWVGVGVGVLLNYATEPSVCFAVVEHSSTSQTDIETVAAKSRSSRIQVFGSSARTRRRRF